MCGFMHFVKHRDLLGTIVASRSHWESPLRFVLNERRGGTGRKDNPALTDLLASVPQSPRLKDRRKLLE